MQVRICEVCGKRSARYVCQECGRKVCEVCLEPRTWICSDCYNRLKSEIPTPAVEAFTWSTPFKLFLLGFLTIFVGMIVMMIASISLGASAGAMIWILPFPPVIVGAGPHLYLIWVAVLAVAVVVLGVVVFFALRRRA